MKRHSRNSSALLLGLFLLAATASNSAAAVPQTGTLTGSVSNTVTSNLLEGAKVELPRLGLTALADPAGRYVLADVPAGTHEIVVSYLGLDPVRGSVTIVAGQRSVQDFDLTSSIYTLNVFKVTGEREGDAAAITAQRNALNLKNVVAMDSFGNLPNMSVGEVVLRLTGIAGTPTNEGLHVSFNVRGMAPGLNTVTVDGGLVPSIGLDRSFQLQSLTSTMFEQLELIKGHTPDKGADSLGGTINMKTRSTLNMKEKRRISYSANVRVAPPFTDQIPQREQHRAHPLLTLAYQEVFSVLGGERNLGVAANVFYSENAVGVFRTFRNFQNTLDRPAYIYSYRTLENYNNRKQSSLNLKTDYRHSFNTRFTLNLTFNDNTEKFLRSFETEAWTGNANIVPNATTTGIVPGYTDRITTVRPTPGSNIDIKSASTNNFIVRTFQADFGGEHDLGRLLIDYNVGIGRNNLKRGFGKGGFLTSRLSNVGWILDRTASDLYPRFTQTAGPSMTDLANYRPVELQIRPNIEKQEVAQLRGNVRYSLPIAIPLHLKTGLSWREQRADLENRTRLWNYIGPAGVLVDPNYDTFDARKTGRLIPQADVVPLVRDRQPVDPALWQEDLYFHQQLRYTGTRGARETVTAGYAMAQGRMGRAGWLERTGFLTGVRTERTDTGSYGSVAARVTSTGAQRLQDPVGSAERDFGGSWRKSKGSYTKSFPSAHLSHDLTTNLKARLSWSTSFGRPAMSNLLPTERGSDAGQTVTLNNPSLRPQTAKNWDASIDYYFEPVGNFSIGWFHKTIADYIVSGVEIGTVPDRFDNGYNGQYRNYRILTTSNAGTAVAQGWEFSYQQQFTFLPGLLKGLSGSANYTIIDTHGDFGGLSNRKTGQVAGFIPRAGNASLSWRYRAFSTRVLYNFTGEHIVEYNAVRPALNLYRFARETVNLGVAYQIRPSLTINLDIANLFNKPQVFYSGFSDRMQNTDLSFIAITGGISGRF